MGTSPRDAAAIVEFGFEAGGLKLLPRAGWLLAGQPSPESVADHSWRVGVLAYLIAHQEGANADHAAVLGMFHDFPEVRTGDVPSVGKPYVQTASPHQVIADQTEALPAKLAAHIVALVDEHEAAKSAKATAEARCSRDADKLDCLLQALTYGRAGNSQLGPWVSSMADAVATVSGRALVEAALVSEPGAWWRGFAENFGRLTVRDVPA
jgi:5'-deoxynucleotidase YfbR-like HD superfamily hydrolase